MKDLKIYLFIASALLVIYLVAQYNRPVPVNWTETFNTKDKIPYGTYVLYNRLNDIFPGAQVTNYREPVYNVINDYEIEHGTYLIICPDIDLNEYDYAKLVNFVKNGNDVLIASRSFGTEFNKRLHIETASEIWIKNVNGSLRFTNRALDTTQTYAVDKNLNNSYFENIDTGKAYILGKTNLNHINFIRYRFGKGSLYLNTNPLMFTNYSLLKKDGSAYAAVVLSHLKNDKNLIWDEYYTNGRDDDQSPMRVFLRNPSLRWAYYIALAALLAFVLYQKKRRQRIIPIIEPLANTTVDFVNVVGQVYYEQRDNANIAQKKASYFLEYLRTKYNLKTNILNDEFVTALAHKSGVNEPFVRTLLNQVTTARSGARVTDTELIELNKNIEQFYIQSR